MDSPVTPAHDPGGVERSSVGEASEARKGLSEGLEVCASWIAWTSHRLGEAVLGARRGGRPGPGALSDLYLRQMVPLSGR